MDVSKLLDKCKEVCGAKTEGELAKRLGISKQALSSYRHGQRLPDPVVCATIAGLSGVALAKVLGIVGEARAISREEKAVWRKLAATAALLFFALGLQLDAHAWAMTDASGNVPVRHYAKSLAGAVLHAIREFFLDPHRRQQGRGERFFA